MGLKQSRLFVFVVIATLLCTSALAATAPALGTAQNFVVLGGSTVTNTGNSVINGDLGVWPGLAVTGFPPGSITGTIHAGDAVAQQAQSDLVTAYNDLAGQVCDVNLTGQDLGGMTLTAGSYCFSTSAQLTGTLTLDAQGDSNAVFLFQMGSTLTLASGAIVQLINSASDCNVFWQVGSSATLGTGSSLAGSILALTSITLNTSASVSGQTLARNGAVTIDTNDVVLCVPACPSISLSPETLPTGVVDELYSQVISATGGTSPYTFTITDGSLPIISSAFDSKNQTSPALGAPNFTLDPNTGVLSGTPTIAGSWPFTITATDANGCTGFRNYILTINPVSCPNLTILPALIPNAEVGVPYSQSITASGSTPDTYVFTLTGTPPPGLALNPLTPPAIKSVDLMGTPNETGTFPFTITATDQDGCQVSQNYSILVNPAPCPLLTILPATLPNPEVDQLYSQILTASGGLEPYTFALTTGSLPTQLTLNPNTGLISGIPDTTGSFSFTITVTDANGCQEAQAYTVQVAPAPCPLLTILPKTLPNPEVGQLYSQLLTASGGLKPYTFALTTGSLPTQLTLNPNTGLISGIPDTAGSFSFTVTVTDANGCQGTQAYTVQVAPAPCPLIEAFPASLPAPVFGMPYSQTITASGGLAPYTFTVTAGALPSLLTLNPTTGLISGIPDSFGSYNFTITIRDSNNCIVTKEYSILVLQSVPTLSGWSQIALISLLAIAGAMFLRKRNLTQQA